MRLIMMGTGPFAVPTFRALVASAHEVLGLVTRPDRPAHRREKTPVNPMREVAGENELEVFEPESINSPEASGWLRQKAADLFVVCDYGQILSRETLALARLGGINLHASLLPKYRGAAPINWAIYHGEKETGVSVIHMTPQLDAGPCLVQRATEIGADETAPQLETRLADMGVATVVESIEILAGGGQARGIPQDAKLATRAPRLKKEDGLIDWSRPASAILNQVRAFEPWPKTYTFWDRPGEEPLRLILEEVEIMKLDSLPALVRASRESMRPGTVMQASKTTSNDAWGGQRLIVKCGEDAVALKRVQPAGKRTMSAAEFLCGHKIAAGERLG
jgi:methionyl-tRNA formyltransferase